MKRTTVSLPDDLALVAAREARRRGVSLSEVTRQALTEHLRLVPDERRRMPFGKLGRSGHTDTSERVDEILAHGWIDSIEQHRDR